MKRLYVYIKAQQLLKLYTQQSLVPAGQFCNPVIRYAIGPNLRVVPPKLTQNQKSQLTQELIEQDNFIGIFERRGELVDISEGNERRLDVPVSTFINDCCIEKTAAMKLLEDNGFKVHKSEGWFTKRIR